MNGQPNIAPGRTVFEETPVLDGGLTLESPSVVLEGGVALDVDEDESLELVNVAKIQSADHGIRQVAKYHARLRVRMLTRRWY